MVMPRIPKTSGNPERNFFKIGGLVGIDVSSPVQDVPDNKCRHLLNYIPIIGKRIKKVPGWTAVTTTVAGNPLPSNIVRMYTVYVGAAAGTPAVPFLVMFLAAGSCYAKNLNTGTTALVWAAATFTDPRIVQWKQERIVVVDPANGSFTWNGTTAAVVDATIDGNYITVWEGRLFIFRIDTNAVIFTAPDTYNDFNTANGAGVVEITVPNVRGNITGIATTTDIIYVFAENATLTISNLEQDGANVVFRIANLYGYRGCKFPDTIAVYENHVYMMDEKGIWEIVGYDSRRISEPDIDELLSQLQNSEFSPVGFIASMYNIDFYAVVVKIAIPGVTNDEKWMLCFYNQGWFIIKYGHDITFVSDGIEIGGTIYNFEADGVTVRNYFNEASTEAIESTFISKGYTLQNDFLDKRFTRFGITISEMSGTLNFQAAILGDEADYLFTLSPTFNASVVWVNEVGTVVQWQNGTPADVDWVLNGDTVQVKRGINGRGKAPQIILSETSAQRYTIDEMLLEYYYRARW